MQVDIPGRGIVRFESVALDYNGTIAIDGILIEEVARRLEELSRLANVHVLTADTFGTVRAQCAPYDVSVDVFDSGNAAESKRRLVAGMQGGVCCFGNGFNDRLMFQEATLSVGIMEREGMSAALLGCADIVVAHASDAFDLLLKPDRLRATLRG